MHVAQLRVRAHRAARTLSQLARAGAARAAHDMYGELREAMTALWVEGGEEFADRARAWLIVTGEDYNDLYPDEQAAVIVMAAAALAMPEAGTFRID